jgi:hypothetical protein
MTVEPRGRSPARTRSGNSCSTSAGSGLTQHDLYHAGQIALLKRALTEAARAFRHRSVRCRGDR